MFDGDIQQLLFEEIKKRLPEGERLVTAVAKVLKISDDNARRRIKGSTALLAQEMAILTDHFQISLDNLIFQNSTTVFANFSAFSKPVKSFQEFVEGLLQQLQFVHSLKTPYLYYASQEIPVFQYMYYPELIKFKLYAWGMTTWNFDYLKDKPFNFDLVTYPTMELMQEILPLYHRLHSTDLWSLNIVDNTLNQIEYVTYSQQFEQPKDALLLCDRILELVEHMRKMAETGVKFAPGDSPQGGGDFNLYHNELMYTNNTMLVTTDHLKFVISVFCNPNFLQSTDQNLCNYTHEWMENIISKSNPMSIHSRRNRKWYFNRLEDKVQASKDSIEQFINDEL